jgi:predicted nucleic acid-binding protein
LIAAYVDASVVMRIILRQPNQLREWPSLDLGVSSELLSVECYRTVERVWRNHEFDDEEFEAKRAEVTAMLRNLELRSIEPAILHRAAEPFPSYIATLDAVHLATALAYRREQPEDERPILFATHDRQLAKAAAALDFEVIGIAA